MITLELVITIAAATHAAPFSILDSAPQTTSVWSGPESSHPSRASGQLCKRFTATDVGMTL